ncbi:hypothetical protein [Phyllobacterium sp. P5_D12]
MTEETDGLEPDSDISKKIRELSARQTILTNELAKYKAAASDRMSTAAISIGFFSPAAAIIINPSSMTGLDYDRGLLLMFATCNWFVLSLALHNLGRYVLRKELI